MTPVLLHCGTRIAKLEPVEESDIVASTQASTSQMATGSGEDLDLEKGQALVLLKEH